jgi:biotin carboxyl carrier protein
MGKPGQRIVVKVNGRQYVVEVGDLDTSPVTVVVDGHSYQVEIGDQPAEVQVRPADQEKTEEQDARVDTNESRVLAPLPGDILEVSVESGQHVNTGDPLCIIDAMKMRNEIRSPRDGCIAEVKVSIGQVVEYGDVLITFT